MSRIGADECSYMDAEWYGVDRRGNIAVFCSAGEGSIPEFVCENAERTDALIEYFDKSQKTTSSVLLFKRIERAEQVARNFSDKGLYYFDSDDGTKFGTCNLHPYYTKQSYPQRSLKYELLPEHIRQMLVYNFMEIEDFSLENAIHVKHAYE